MTYKIPMDYGSMNRERWFSYPQYPVRLAFSHLGWVTIHH